MVAAKKDAVSISKKDFMEQLEFFLVKDKKTETKHSDSPEVAMQERDTFENEDDFDAVLNINHLTNQPVETKTEVNLLGKVVELSAKEVAVDLQMYSIPSEKVVQENPEHEVEDAIENLLSENELELAEVFKNNDLEYIEKISQGKLEPILTRTMPNAAVAQNLEQSENPEIKEMQNGEVEEEILIEETKKTAKLKDGDFVFEKKIETQAVKLSSTETLPIDRKESISGANNFTTVRSEKNPEHLVQAELSSIDTSESINRVGFLKELVASNQKVTQENFVLNNEMESTIGDNKVTSVSNQQEPEWSVQAELSSIEAFEPINRVVFSEGESVLVQKVVQKEFRSNLEALKSREVESITGDDKEISLHNKQISKHLSQAESSSIEAFEPVNRVVFPKGLEAPVQKVVQEDIISNTEIESTSEGDKLTRARNEQVSEHLGQVESSSIGGFEPVNQVRFTNETNDTVQSLAPEEFVSNLETLMIEETESTRSGDKVTTARIQLTPERLGKVDLQIEINGKELTAKLIVEQKETKEWIDQQVAHLKEKLLAQEITVKDFQVVVHEENLNDAFMNSAENPFFKQKEKDSQARKEQRLLKSQTVEVPVQQEERSYSTRSGISILV